MWDEEGHPPPESISEGANLDDEPVDFCADIEVSASMAGAGPPLPRPFPPDEGLPDEGVGPLG
jgi:hypothetical protein